MRPCPFTVVIYFANGSVDDQHSFSAYSDALQFARSGISYSGGRVRRVELLENGGSRSLWDTSWTPLSKAAGLASSK